MSKLTISQVELDNFFDAYASTANELPDAMLRLSVPEGRFAVFTHRGGLPTLSHTIDYFRSL